MFQQKVGGSVTLYDGWVLKFDGDGLEFTEIDFELSPTVMYECGDIRLEVLPDIIAFNGRAVGDNTGRIHSWHVQRADGIVHRSSLAEELDTDERQEYEKLRSDFTAKRYTHFNVDDDTSIEVSGKTVTVRRK